MGEIILHAELITINSILMKLILFSGCVETETRAVYMASSVHLLVLNTSWWGSRLAGMLSKGELANKCSCLGSFSWSIVNIGLSYILTGELYKYKTHEWVDCDAFCTGRLSGDTASDGVKVDLHTVTVCYSKLESTLQPVACHWSE